MPHANELCFQTGPDDAAWSVVIVPPLFEEANRMRRTLVLMMRALASRRIRSLLPDLPGQNDSLVATHEVTTGDWRTAVAQWVEAQKHPVLIASFRGGALIDDSAGAAAWWRLAPVTGASLLRTMLRVRVASDREAGISTSIDALFDQSKDAPLMLSGNCLSPAMVAALHGAVPAAPAPLRSVALGDGPNMIAGAPLWLRAEPGEDSGMAIAMAHDIAEWARQCGIC